jgi:hypothetical protein
MLVLRRALCQSETVSQFKIATRGFWRPILQTGFSHRIWQQRPRASALGHSERGYETGPSSARSLVVRLPSDANGWKSGSIMPGQQLVIKAAKWLERGMPPIFRLFTSLATGRARTRRLMSASDNPSYRPNYNLRVSIIIALGMIWFGGLLSLLIWYMPKGF